MGALGNELSLTGLISHPPGSTEPPSLYHILMPRSVEIRNGGLKRQRPDKSRGKLLVHHTVVEPINVKIK